MDYDTSVSNVIQETERNFVPNVANPDDPDIDKQYFNDFIKSVSHCFNLINNLLSNKEFHKQLVVRPIDYAVIVRNSLTLCGENHDSSCVWCDETCAKLSDEVIDKFCKIFNCTTKQLLVEVSFGESRGVENKMAMLLLKFLRPKLLTDTWRTYPGAVACYKWIIMNIEIPYMQEYIYTVIPTTLNIIDDYHADNKVLGLKCLSHILSNVTMEQLKNYCSIDLFYTMVKPLLHWREKETIIPLLNCIIEIAKKGNSKYQKQSVDPGWCEYMDETLAILLPIIEFEQDVRLQTEYTEALYIILNASETNVSLARWSHRFISVIECYAQFPHTSYRTMQVIELYLKKCFPILHKYGRKLAIISGKVVYYSTDNETFELSCRCYKILYEVLSETISLPLLEEIKVNRNARLKR